MANKEFKVQIEDTEKTLYFARPTHEDVLALDMEFRRIYSIALRAGILTKAEATKKHAETGAWSEEDEEKINRLLLEISLLERVVRNEDGKQTQKQRQDAALKTTKLRTELLTKMNVRTDLYDNTAEAMAEEQKIHKFVQLCCYDKETDERMFDGPEDYQNFINDHKDAASAIYREAYFFDYDLPEDISESWAEVQFLKEEAGKIEEGVKEQEKAKTTKKKTRKKTTKKAKSE